MLLSVWEQYVCGLQVPAGYGVVLMVPSAGGVAAAGVAVVGSVVAGVAAAGAAGSAEGAGGKPSAERSWLLKGSDGAGGKKWFVSL